MELDFVHAEMKQKDLSAQQAATCRLEAELSPRIASLLDQVPQRQYLNADELMDTACQRFVAGAKPPANLDLWLSGVLEELLLVKLLQYSATGDKEAENEFGRRLRPLLSPTLQRKLRRGSPISRFVGMSDLVQTAYRRLAEERRKKGQIPSHLVNWLKNVVTNYINDLYRKIERRHTVSLTEKLSEAVAAVESGAIEKIADRELAEWAIAQMNTDIRTIYRLRFEEGLGWEDIGKALGKATSTVWKMWNDWLKEARRRDGCAATGEENADGPRQCR